MLSRTLTEQDAQDIAEAIRHLEALRNPGADVTVQIGERIGPRLAVTITRDTTSQEQAAA